MGTEDVTAMNMYKYKEGLHFALHSNQLSLLKYKCYKANVCKNVTLPCIYTEVVKCDSLLGGHGKACCTVKDLTLFLPSLFLFALWRILGRPCWQGGCLVGYNQMMSSVLP